MGKKWTSYCQQEGIEHYTCAPYGPSMNSYAERVIKTIVNHAPSMLWHAGIAEDFWALAVKASVYLLNRSPHSGLGGECTPYEMWYKKKPHVGHVRTWGCRAYAAIPKERRKKFDSKTKECILVGFFDTENLYLLWDTEAGETIKRRDVVFHEHIMGQTRNPLPMTRDLTGSELEEFKEEGEELEDLYPVIDELKGEEWEEVPEQYIPLRDELVTAGTIPKSYPEAMNTGCWEVGRGVQIRT